MSSLFASLETR